MVPAQTAQWYHSSDKQMVVLLLYCPIIVRVNRLHKFGLELVWWSELWGAGNGMPIFGVGYGCLYHNGTDMKNKVDFGF